MSGRSNARHWGVLGAVLLGASASSAALTDNKNDCADCPAMRTVPAGAFPMGKTVDYGYGEMDGPTHTVTIDQPFKLAAHEVTLGEFRAFTRDTGYVSAGKCNVYKEDAKWFIDPARNWADPGFAQAENHPVVCVSWRDAQAYIDWLNRKTGRRYRLPSEAEWEYVASTADVGKGAAITHELANMGRVKCCGGETGGRDKWIHTAPVGSFPADKYGLHDIRGNVWEWQHDCYHSNYVGAPVNGDARVSCPTPGYRVVRGGSYGDGAEYINARLRLQGTENQGYFTVGFRVAESLQPNVAAEIERPVSGMFEATRQRNVDALGGFLASSVEPASGRPPACSKHCWKAQNNDETGDGHDVSCCGYR